MDILRVNLGNRSYPIIIGSKLEKIDKSFFCIKKRNKVMLVTNKRISKLWKNNVITYLSTVHNHIDEIILDDGEQFKQLKTVEFIISIMLKNKYSRNSILIALGGGVIGDIVGFVASIYLRGIRYIQLPTTFLSQIDSSIGGKTGVNHILGKNMIGSFWQPKSVILNLDFLSSLSFLEIQSGMAEVVKYAIIFDKYFFVWLEKNFPLVLKLDKLSVLYCIKKCCELKAKIVSNDEKENNLRALLNLGHTYGHAIETELGYGFWSHGQAVSVGIVISSYTSFLLGILQEQELLRIISLLKNIGLPINISKNSSAQSYLNHMRRDKKVISGVLRLILPKKIGKCDIYSNIDSDIILKSIRSVMV
ncbi:3-dehydroquinate synthase [Buchnera aphidicola (Anoecia corni)]|uniref:3-dehydroquinate synthase n=1 Tax=Buchnera aphidicola (Anoecia corni) TaxID=2994477 RepID=A0AAT9IGT3_9GAMM